MKGVVVFLAFVALAASSSVPLDKCLCGPYEEHSECLNVCNTCETIRSGKLCSRPAVCTRGCDCVKGYSRNDEGVCVPTESCHPPKPSCPPYQAYSTCVDICNTCEVKTTGSSCAFLVCNEGCDCIKGYTRDASNNCIPVQKCPRPPIKRY